MVAFGFGGGAADLVNGEFSVTGGAQAADVVAGHGEFAGGKCGGAMKALQESFAFAAFADEALDAGG